MAKTDHNIVLEKLKRYNGVNNFPFNAKNIYQYGSRVYGTIRDKSDYDLIIVSDDFFNNVECDEGQVYGTIYSSSHFQQLINEHEISALECLFLSQDKIIKKDIDFNFDLDLSKLRRSISAKSSNSWVKAKKKLIVEKDFDRDVALKSLFHSMRIIEFGRQIAIHGKIVDFTAANHLHTEIFSYDTNDWEFFKNKYQTTYNTMMSEFRKVAPK